MAEVKTKLYTESESESDSHLLHRELDEVSCPICMDHPHNAVRLLCSSQEKGCKSYICDTSYRHSNCLDRFKKLLTKSIDSSTQQNSLLMNFNTSTNDSSNMDLSVSPMESRESNDTVVPVRSLERSGPNNSVRQPLIGNLDSEGEGILEISGSESLWRSVEQEESHEENVQESRMSLKCPLCRGAVRGWKVVEDARKYLNMKKRSCSRESCFFVGNYQELRRHARRVHPTTRPSDTDSSRQRAWRRLERQREYGDFVSAVRSFMPGAVVDGDYVIENGDRISAERENSNAGELNAPWWTPIVLVQMFGSIDHIGGSGAHQPWPWQRERQRRRRRRIFLSGETLLGLRDDSEHNEEDLHVLSDGGDGTSPVPRRRRRLERSRSGESS